VTARDDVFASIRRSLHVTGAEAPRRAAVSERLSKSPRGVIPERGRAGLPVFRDEALRAGATLADIASSTEIPAEVARYLREHNLPATLRIGADPRLASPPWAETTLETSHGASDGHDLNAISAAFAAIAETGTLALISGADNPTTLNFLLFAEDVVGDMESVFTRLREKFGAGRAPRTLNFITGPSRSADIEQTLLFGAHGPRRLHIIVVGGSSS
jgi:L-lactate dehydrogenase complex protein LldG